MSLVEPWNQTINNKSIPSMTKKTQSGAQESESNLLRKFPYLNVERSATILGPG